MRLLSFFLSFFLTLAVVICLSAPSKPIITRAAVNAEELELLMEEFCLFKSDTASELMRRNYVRHQQEQRRKMLAKLEDNSLQADSRVRCVYNNHRYLSMTVT